MREDRGCGGAGACTDAPVYPLRTGDMHYIYINKYNLFVDLYQMPPSILYAGAAGRGHLEERKRRGGVGEVEDAPDLPSQRPESVRVSPISSPSCVSLSQAARTRKAL